MQSSASPLYEAVSCDVHEDHCAHGDRESNKRTMVALRLLASHGMAPPATLRSLAARNALLATLSSDAVRRLSAGFERVQVKSGQILCTPGVRMPYAYFPLRGVMALVAITAQGETVQVAMVGPSGVVGPPTVLHDDALPYQAVAPVTLEAIRMPVSALVAELRENPSFQSRLLAHAHQQVTAMTRATTCYRFHTAVQRLCWWLLTASDGLQSDTVDVTHDLLAQLLGTTRTVISAAANVLDDDGLIRQRRGRVRLLRRPQLCARVCDCYDVPSRMAVPQMR